MLRLILHCFSVLYYIRCLWVAFISLCRHGACSIHIFVFWRKFAYLLSLDFQQEIWLCLKEAWLGPPDIWVYKCVHSVLKIQPLCPHLPLPFLVQTYLYYFHRGRKHCSNSLRSHNSNTFILNRLSESAWQCIQRVHKSQHCQGGNGDAWRCPLSVPSRGSIFCQINLSLISSAGLMCF